MFAMMAMHLRYQLINDLRNATGRSSNRRPGRTASIPGTELAAVMMPFRSAFAAPKLQYHDFWPENAAVERQSPDVWLFDCRKLELFSSHAAGK